MDYSDNADLKEVFNTCLTMPLSPWEMGRLGHLPFWKFVCQLHQSSRAEFLRSTNFHHTDYSPLPPAVSESPSPPVTHKRLRFILHLY